MIASPAPTPRASRYADLVGLPLTRVGRGWGRTSFLRSLVRAAKLQGVVCILTDVGDSAVCLMAGPEHGLDEMLSAMALSTWHSGPKLVGPRMASSSDGVTHSVVRPILLPSETAWLTGELESPAPNVSLLAALLNWAAMRHTEMGLPGSTPPEPFPHVPSPLQ